MVTSHIHLRTLTVRYIAPRHDATTPSTKAPLDSPAACAALCTALLGQEACEVFGLFCLTSKLRLIAYHEVSRGSLDTTVVHPREVFKAALLANAAAVLLAHNHPSGDPTPSADDDIVTRRLVMAGALLGIDVLDHVIVGDRRYVSYKEMGRL